MAESTVVFASLLDVPGAFDGLPDACPGADTPIKEAQADAEKPKGRPPKPALTREVIAANLAANGITVKWNEISHKLEYHGIPESLNLNPENILNDFPVILHDTLKTNYAGNLQSVCNLLTAIGGQCRYNPVLDVIAAEPWDGYDYLENLLRIMGIADNDLSCILTIVSQLEKAIKA